jgi:hypothetical protein
MIVGIALGEFVPIAVPLVHFRRCPFADTRKRADQLAGHSPIGLELGEACSGPGE